MASIGISEFTFGFAFLHEQAQANWGKLKAAPILPSLKKEQDAAWDAHLPVIGTDFYYQFKLADYLSAWNAKYIQEGIYKAGYYRISLHRKHNNQQHRRLRMHAAHNRHTYYVAPEFQLIEEFNAAYLSRQIGARSRLIPVGKCKQVNDGKQHHITFQTGKSKWKQHSEVYEDDESYRGEDIGQLYAGAVKDFRPIDDEFAGAVFRKTADIANRVLLDEGTSSKTAAARLLDFAPSQEGRRATLLRAADILSVVLGVTLVIVGRSD